jgi:Flp pilus assembly protein TadD
VLGNASAAKTDFKRDATVEQGFNMHMELGRIRAAESNPEAAANEYLIAIEISEKKGAPLSGGKLGSDKQALAHRKAAECYDQLGRFAQSQVHYSKALKLAPADAKIWNSAGYSYYMQNRLADAERALKIAANRDKNDPKIQTNFGLTLAAAGKTDEALAAFSKAGGSAVGHANLGFILAAMGKKDEARKHYQIAASLQPGLSPARDALARLDGQKPMQDAAVAVASATMPLPAKPPTTTSTAAPPPVVPLVAQVTSRKPAKRGQNTKAKASNGSFLREIGSSRAQPLPPLPEIIPPTPIVSGASALH